MDKKEILKLSEKHTSQFGYLAQCGEDAALAFVEFSVDSLVDFANECEKAGMEKAGEMLSDALQSDLEHGVKWLNEKAAKDFYTAYPAVSKIIGEINSI